MLCWRVSNTQSSTFQHQRWVDDRPRSCYKQAMEPFCDIQRYSWALASRSLTRRSTRDSQYKRKKGSRNAVFSSSRHGQQQASGSERGKGEKQREEKKVIEAAACCWYVEPSKRDIWFHVSQEIYLFRESSRLALGSLVALILDRLRSLWLCVLLLWHKSNTRNEAVPQRTLIDFVFSTSPYLTLIEYVFHIITIQFRWCWWKGMTTTMSTDRMKNEKKENISFATRRKLFDSGHCQGIEEIFPDFWVSSTVNIFYVQPSTIVE